MQLTLGNLVGYKCEGFLNLDKNTLIAVLCLFHTLKQCYLRC